MLECLARRRDVLRNQREALLAQLQNGETGDPLKDISTDLWEVRSRLIVYGDFEIMDDPPAEFVELWRGIESESRDQLREWLISRYATANRIISEEMDDLPAGEVELLKQQGNAVKSELEIIFSMIGGIWTPEIVSVWKGDSE